MYKYNLKNSKHQSNKMADKPEESEKISDISKEEPDNKEVGEEITVTILPPLFCWYCGRCNYSENHICLATMKFSD